MPSDKNYKRKIAFVVPYPFGTAPGQRFRYEQYLDILSKKGFSYAYYSFLDISTNKILYKKGQILRKVYGIFKGFIKRLLLLPTLTRFDYIFIFREASPIGPPIFEWLIVKVLRKKIIYDFDDAIWLPNTSENNKIAAGMKWHQKVASICGWSYKISCGNDYLCEYARKFNSQVILNPTTIDTEGYHNPSFFRKRDSKKLTIGWTGSHSTLFYVDMIVEVFSELEKKYDFEFWVICDKEPELPLKSLVFKRWEKRTEIEDLFQLDIGIMPLYEDPWSEGKCGFKALQYMSLGIPAIISPIGVNKKIVDHGKNGYLCRTKEEWYNCLEELILNAEKRKAMGAEAKLKILNNYSVTSNQANFLGLFE